MTCNSIQPVECCFLLKNLNLLPRKFLTHNIKAKLIQLSTQLYKCLKMIFF